MDTTTDTIHRGQDFGEITGGGRRRGDGARYAL